MTNSNFLKELKPAHKIIKMDSDETLTVIRDVFSNTALPFTSLHPHIIAYSFHFRTEEKEKLILLKRQTDGKNGTIEGRGLIKLDTDSDLVKTLHLPETNKKQYEYLGKDC